MKIKNKKRYISLAIVFLFLPICTYASNTTFSWSNTKVTTSSIISLNLKNKRRNDLVNKYKIKFNLQLKNTLDNLKREQLESIINKVKLKRNDIDSNQKINFSIKEKYLIQIDALISILEYKLSNLNNITLLNPNPPKEDIVVTTCQTPDVFNNTWTLSSKDLEVQKIAMNYIKCVKKINYNQAVTGFILDKFTEDKNYYLWSWWIVLEWKRLTWSFINIFNDSISKENSKYYLAYKNNKYELKFIKWFTKMKYSWKIYDFNEKNLSSESNYYMELFASWKDAYVIVFQNNSGKEEMRAAYREYLAKTDEIMDKYWDDPYITNSLIQILNKAYDIRLNLLK